jgi:N-acyl-phosphatidylethanolamine-hydrolysing phospholipase D
MVPHTDSPLVDARMARSPERIRVTSDETRQPARCPTRAIDPRQSLSADSLLYLVPTIDARAPDSPEIPIQADRARKQRRAASHEPITPVTPMDVEKLQVQAPWVAKAQSKHALDRLLADDGVEVDPFASIAQIASPDQPTIDTMDFIGPKIPLGPPRNPWDESEKLSYFKKNMLGQYRGDWPGASEFPMAFVVVKRFVTHAYPKVDKEELKTITQPVDRHVLAIPRCGPSGVQATWMGHASYLVQVGGINILHDPIFSKHCFFVQFAGPKNTKRIVDVPIHIADLPRIDIVSISHNHYDHLDVDSVQLLRKHFQPTFVVPKGMRSWFKSLGWEATEAEKAEGITNAVKAKVKEFEWWEGQYVAPPSQPDLRVFITMVPAQHWSMRTGPWDKLQQLWGGWVFEVDVSKYMTDSNAFQRPGPCVRRFFHSGDTGYSEKVFGEIGRVFRRFDLAMLPIGAYHPRWYLKNDHVDPAQAVKIHVDLNRPTLSVGMHWGTFLLSDEPVTEPPRLLAEAARAAGLASDEFIALKHGQTVTVQAPPVPQHCGIAEQSLSKVHVRPEQAFG